jgi:hypothetical protein
MAARAFALVLVPLLAFGGSVAAAHAQEARQEATGRRSLFERARDWQRTADSSQGWDLATLRSFYAPRSTDLPDPREFRGSRLLEVHVDAGGRRGVTTHATEHRRGRYVELLERRVVWARGGATDPWRIVGRGEDE